MQQILVNFSLILLLVFSQACAMQVIHFGQRVSHATGSECLACHGSGVDNLAKKVCSEGVSRSHPVNLDYPPVGKEREFRPAATIEAAGLRLEKGRITCISCHDLQSTIEKFLALDNRGSQLCLTCHIR